MCLIWCDGRPGLCPAEKGKARCSAPASSNREDARARTGCEKAQHSLDDIGWMQPSIYHRGLMVGETPNIDRIGQEGAIFMDYVAMQSCTSGRCAFFTGMYPLRTGLIPPQLPGSPSYLRPGTRRSPSSFMILATPPASSARTTWAIIPKPCRRRTASRNTGVTSTTSMPCSR
jgi:Sulfatase